MLDPLEAVSLGVLFLENEKLRRSAYYIAPNHYGRRARAAWLIINAHVCCGDSAAEQQNDIVPNPLGRWVAACKHRLLHIPSRRARPSDTAIALLQCHNSPAASNG